MREKFTLANALTAARFVLAPSLPILVWTGHGFYWAVIAVLAGLTDLLDGLAAKYISGSSEFGRKFDIAADKCLIANLLISVVPTFCTSVMYALPFGVLAFYWAVVIFGWKILKMEGRRSHPLARKKTALEMVGFPLSMASPCLGSWSPWFFADTVGIALLYAATALALHLGRMHWREFWRDFWRWWNKPASERIWTS